MTATISSFHSTEIVLIAAGITAAICLSISLFAIQTKIDFTMCSVTVVCSSDGLVFLWLVLFDRLSMLQDPVILCSVFMED
ncbi:hypothetical protein Btru_075017 [Bulinus truncatus]|nr:hypothetical protein Btru_075017 [Bulinus truncatus]